MCNRQATTVRLKETHSRKLGSMWHKLRQQSIVFLIFSISLSWSCCCCWAQQTHIKLEQGDLIGLKVFPDGARTAVYAFLGIPYAKPPLGELRFAAAQAHSGWNRTLQAVSMQAICPQLSNTIYDENADGSIARVEPTSENCLYLNIWTPETALRYGNLPVLVIITGEEFAFDWPRNRANGLDFAAEGVVVVSVQYRNNIFGWLSVPSQEQQFANYGLSDVQLALQWLQRNAASFGGNANQLTLLGHGSGAAPLALASVLLQPTAGKSLATQLILMSPGHLLRALGKGHEARVQHTSHTLIQKLGCHFAEQHAQLMVCLRRKSTEDLLRAYESVYNHGNGSLQLGIQLPGGVEASLTNASQMLPVLLGIGSNEGAFLQDYWLDMARESYDALRRYINHTVLPNVLRAMESTAATGAHLNAINWRYFSGDAGSNVVQLLSGMQRLLSESMYETPFLHLLELLNGTAAGGGVNVYAYVFDQTPAMDMRGKRNLFGGASHSADLPMLLGPSLFQQIARRRFTTEEEQLCRKLRTAFVNFVKGGNPTPGRIYDAWLPYTKQRPFIYSLGELSKTATATDEAQIEQLLRGEQQTSNDRSLSRPNRNDYKGTTYQVASNRKANSYVASNQQDSGYASHLQRVFGFWRVLVPMADSAEDTGNGALGQRVRLQEANADAARYRQGFYAMLSLVCLLLACLCLCVYLLRRDPLRSATAAKKRFCL